MAAPVQCQSLVSPLDMASVDRRALEAWTRPPPSPPPQVHWEIHCSLPHSQAAQESARSALGVYPQGHITWTPTVSDRNMCTSLDGTGPSLPEVQGG